MRSLLLFLLFVASLLAAAARRNIHSRLLIPVGQQFVLGGDQAGAFQVRARNSGQVAVLFLERAGSGTAVERSRLVPGQSARLAFAAGAAVLVRNLGSWRARLDLDIEGPGNSRMTYEPAATGPKK